ncbi:MAG: methyl-accepting chemotaxis protein [Bacillota bacterium]
MPGQDYREEEITIIGGGEVGCNLLQIFLDMEKVNVNYVVDLDPEAPAIQLAEKEGVETTTDAMEIVGDRGIDLILEVTGSQEVSDMVKENKPSSTEVISGKTSYFIYNIINEYKSLEGDLVKTVIEHLDDVYNSIKDDSKDVDSLLEQIQSITKNLNMLALNASIEAARAGEAGQGFSVVADEVKSLSSESNKIVGEIEQINANIIELNQSIFGVISDLKSKQ